MRVSVPGGGEPVAAAGSGPSPLGRGAPPRAHLGREQERLRPGSRRLAACALLPVLLVVLSTCRGGGSRGGQEEERLGAATGESGLAGDSPTLDDERLDELRSLPYLQFSRKKARAGESGLVTHDPQRAAPGYRLYTLRGLCRAEMVDVLGRLVHSWQVESCQLLARSELLPTGELLVIGRDGERDRFLRKLRWDGSVIWSRPLPVHHDVEQSSDGRLLALTLKKRAATFRGAELEFRDDLLTLLGEDGSVIASRSLFDALSAEEGLLRRVRARSGGVIDLFHANSVERMRQPHLMGTDPLYDPDHVLVSIRNQDLVTIIDWTDGRRVWSWGKGELSGPHDATLLASGNILVFDNGTGRRWSRVVEVDPRSRRITWEYRAEKPEDFFSLNLGAAQRLENGNTLIANSESGEAFEVTAAGEVVWRFLVPHLNEKGKRAVIVRVNLHPMETVEPWLEGARRP